jgi:hypothetical protein
MKLVRVIAAPLSLSSRLVGSKGRLNWRLVSSLLAVAAIQIAAVLLGCWLDNSWYLPAEHGFPQVGRGFLQHYGAWAILITDPLLLAASGFLDRQFCVTMLSLPTRPDRDAAKEVTHALRRWVPIVRGRGGIALLYVLFVVVGIYAWEQNVTLTINPLGSHRHAIFSHHDVFDSGLHIWSFLAFKACLFLSWVIVYPIVGFKFLTIAFVTFSILRIAEKRCLLCPRVEHPDGCYGLKNVGTLNIAILAPYFLAFFVMYALWVTHQMLYGSIVIPMIGVSAIFILTSFLIIFPAYLVLWRARNNEFRNLVRSSRQPPTDDRDLLQFAARRIFFSTANASPYSDTTKILIVAMRVTPLIGVAIKLFR